MWIITNRGFMSIVAKDEAGKPSGSEPEAIVSVRFRRPEDAAALFPNHEYVPTPNGDYCGRVFPTRAEAAEVVMRAASGIDYDNFKSSIPKEDNALYKACTSAWSVFGKLQDGGPYGLRHDYAGQGSLFSDGYTYGGNSAARSASVFSGVARRAALGHSPLQQRDPFCDGCGMRKGVENLDEDRLCSECGGGASEAMDYCDVCGKDVPVNDLSADFLCADCELADLPADEFDAEDDQASATGACTSCGLTYPKAELSSEGHCIECYDWTKNDSNVGSGLGLDTD